MCLTVRAIHLGEPKQHVFESPLARCTFLDPMSCNSKVSVGVVGLPCVASKIDFACHHGALICERQQENMKQYDLKTYIKMTTEEKHLLFEHVDDLHASFLGGR